MLLKDSVIKKLEFNKVLRNLEKFAGSNLAKEKIMDIKPGNNLNVVKILQCETSEAKDVLRLNPNFRIGVIRNIKNSFRKIELEIPLDTHEFLAISDNLRTSKKIKSFFKNVKEDWKLLNKEIQNIYILKDLEDEINRIITEEGKISENASAKLKDIRKNIVSNQLKIKNYLNRLISSNEMQKKLQDNIVTVRENRYVIPVKQEYRSQVKGLVHDQSSSGATIFIEPIEVVELNNKLRTLFGEEKEEINKILLELTIMVKDNLENIKISLDALVELDIIFAKANYSLDLNCISPMFNDKGLIKLKKARHPLLDKDKVVPTTFEIGEEFNTVIITGPNTGGKTVAIKTVGLLCCMAQCGLHIPAEEDSEISIFNQIYADIGDEQSIEQSLSTFSSHMRNIIDIVNNVNNNSLVLLDELGAGTDPSEGAALAMAILNKLHFNNAKVIATTHYGQLKNYAYNTPGVQNASVEFDINTLKPTYRLVMGLPGKSNAFEISLRLGLSGEIIEKAKQFIDTSELKADELIKKLEEDQIKCEREKNAAILSRKEIDNIKKELHEKSINLKNKRNEIISDAAKEAREIVKKAQEESKKILQNLENSKEIQENQQKLKEMDEDLKVKSKKDIVHKGEIPKGVKSGDIVSVPKLNGKGQVISITDEGEVLIQIGIMKINVNIKDLRVISSEEKKNEVKKNVSKLVTQKSKNISSELDLRGMMVEEAVEKTDKYLDDAYLAGLNQVSIIHGKGTGALRKGIREYLKKRIHIKSLRYGKSAEGGTGITILEFK